MRRPWLVRVWDGNSMCEFLRVGTYEQVRNTCAGYPPAYLWSIE